MKKLIVLSAVLAMAVGCANNTPYTKVTYESVTPFLERNSEAGKIIVVPPEELRGWVKQTEKWAYEAEIQAIRAEKAALRAEAAAAQAETQNFITLKEMDKQKTFFQSMVDKCQAIFDKVLKK